MEPQRKEPQRKGVNPSSSSNKIPNITINEQGSVVQQRPHLTQRRSYEHKPDTDRRGIDTSSSDTVNGPGPAAQQRQRRASYDRNLYNHHLYRRAYSLDTLANEQVQVPVNQPPDSSNDRNLCRRTHSDPGNPPSSLPSSLTIPVSFEDQRIGFSSPNLGPTTPKDNSSSLRELKLDENGKHITESFLRIGVKRCSE